MKIYSGGNVYDKALERIEWLFDEFPNVVVSFSGGKDSTATLELALIVARRKNRLPQKVLFLDQEAEWQATSDYVKEVMYRNEVEPYWIQAPLRISNGTSMDEKWLYCWKEGGDWMREKDPIAYKENNFNTLTFHQLFINMMKTFFPDTKTCMLGGVRTEESPSRYIGLTSMATYKWVTYGKILNKERGHYTFYPIYDWRLSDIWKFIHDNNFKYNKIYDYMYQYGVPVKKMRVSNVHHETAIDKLFFMQEIEPETWRKLTERLKGVNTAAQLGFDDFFIYELPKAFISWKEYRDYLLPNLIQDKEAANNMKIYFRKMDRKYDGMANIDVLHKVCVQEILTNDIFFTKLTNFERRSDVNEFRKWKRGEYYAGNGKVSKFIPLEEMNAN